MDHFFQFKADFRYLRSQLLFALLRLFGGSALQLLMSCVEDFAAANLLLFFVKLYVGLSANSITVYSDAVNNLFDSLSGGISFAGLFAISRAADLSAAHTLKKGEQLFSLLISVLLTFTALYFFYSSLERLVNPWPVSFTSLHVWALLGTALAKLGMLFVYRRGNRKTPSGVLRLMAMDCLLDFFITLTSVFTLWLSAKGAFRADAVCGVGISIAIAAPAVKSVLTNAAALVGFVPAQTRAAVNAVLGEAVAAGEIRSMRYERGEAGVTLLVAPSSGASVSALLERVRAEAGIEVQVLSD